MVVPNTLADIKIKVRRLTKSPTEAQLSETELERYINTFVLYDFPEQLRIFTLREEFNFYTIANIDTYDENNTGYDPNIYISVHPPIYIAGYQSFYSQSREQFFRNYPNINFDEDFGTGDGVTTAFVGTLSQTPILRSNVTIGSTDAAGNRLVLTDNGAGVLAGDGAGTINYATGAVTVNFTAAPATGIAVNAQYVPYVANRPAAILFFNNQFILRPIPDKVYKVNMEVYRQPTELLAAGQTPDLEQWWQYIAYGAAKKIFEDRLDFNSVQIIFPEFLQQQRLVLRRTIDQQTNERTATIYSEQVAFPYGYNNRGVF